MALVGATTIKRERVPNEVSNEQVVFYADDGVDVDIGVGVGAAAAACVVAAAGTGAGQHEGDASCRRYCGFICDKCKKHDEDFITYLQKQSEFFNEFNNKRGVKGIVSNNVRHGVKRSK